MKHYMRYKLTPQIDVTGFFVDILTTNKGSKGNFPLKFLTLNDDSV